MGFSPCNSVFPGIAEGEDGAEMMGDWGGSWNDIARFNAPPYYFNRPYVCEWDGNRGGVYFNGHEYKLFPNVVSWTTAETNSKAEGGHLVTITSPEENAFVKSLIASYSTSWIGFTDSGSEGDCPKGPSAHIPSGKTGPIGGNGKDARQGEIRV